MAWSTGQPWRVVRSLERLRDQIRAAYPQAVPPATPAASWGSIADSAHSSTSDHYPHYYSALGTVAVVCARDFPHAPELGLDAHAVADELRRSRDPRIAYVISNGRITGPQHGWQWVPYYGADPHDTHIHVSTVHTAAADDARDWQIGEAPDMDATQATHLDEIHAQVTGRGADADYALVVGPSSSTAWVAQTLKAHGTQLATINATLATLAGKDFTDEPAIVQGVLAGLDPAVIAAAIPTDLAQRVADELAARLTT